MRGKRKILVNMRERFETEHIGYNSNIWQRTIEEIVEPFSMCDIKLDFRGVTIEKPEISDWFLKLIAYDNVYMVMYNSGSDVKNISILLAVNSTNGEDSGRIKNINTEEVHVINTDRQDKVDVELVSMFFGCTELREDRTEAVLRIQKAIETITYSSSASALESAIKELKAMITTINTFIIDLENVSVQKSVYPALVNTVTRLNDEGYRVSIDNVPDTKSMSIHMAISKGMAIDMPASKRYKIFSSAVRKGTPCIMCIYAAKSKKDEFGRRGNGDIVRACVAIYRGLTSDRKKLMFDLISGDTLQTKSGYYYTSDGEHPGLDISTMIVNINTMGFWDKFMGSECHVNYIVNYERRKIYRAKKDGGWDEQEVTLAEFVKEVLDDFKIVYDAEMMEATINKAKELHGEL